MLRIHSSIGRFIVRHSSVLQPNYRGHICSASGLPPAEQPEHDMRGQRVWKARNEIDWKNESIVATINSQDHWDIAVDDVNDRRVVDESLSRICEQVCANPLLFVAYTFCDI